MKRIIALLSMCLVLLVASVPLAQAQKANAAKKAIELITKGFKKTTPKVPVVKPKVPFKQTTPKQRPRYTSTITCSRCNGHGTVTYWNSYARQYQTYTCSKCNGSGKVHHN